MDQQELAEQFIHLLVPKTLIGLLLRNQIAKTVSHRLLTRLILGKTMKARFSLPDYSYFDKRGGYHLERGVHNNQTSDQCFWH
jgi:hypothetical protein